MDCDPPGSSIHGISQAIILEWVAFPPLSSSKGSFWPKDQTDIPYVSCISRQSLPLSHLESHALCHERRLKPRQCYREETILTPRWICFFYFNLFFPLLLFMKRILSTHNGLPQGTLPHCLNIKPKCLCSGPCLPVDGRKKEVNSLSQRLGFPGGASGKEPACQCRKPKRCKFDPWVSKIPWRRAWQPTPVCLPGKSHGQRSLAGYSPSGSQEHGYDLETKWQQHMYVNKHTYIS